MRASLFPGFFCLLLLYSCPGKETDIPPLPLQENDKQTVRIQDLAEEEQISLSLRRASKKYFMEFKTLGPDPALINYMQQIGPLLQKKEALLKAEEKRIAEVPGLGKIEFRMRKLTKALAEINQTIEKEPDIDVIIHQLTRFQRNYQETMQELIELKKAFPDLKNEFDSSLYPALRNLKAELVKLITAFKLDDDLKKSDILKEKLKELSRVF